MLGFNNSLAKNKNKPLLLQREPIKDNNLLLIITISVFVLLYAFSMIYFRGNFLRIVNVFDLVNLNAPLILIACGLTLVMITGGIDISVAAVTNFVCMLCAVMLQSNGVSPLSALIISVLVGLGIGAFQGFLVAYLKIQPFIVTLVGMFLALGATTMVGSSVSVNDPAFLAWSDAKISFDFLGYRTFNKITGEYVIMPAELKLGAIIMIVVLVLLFVVLRWTRFGRNLYAVGGNSQNALTLGINVDRTKFFAYLICGLLAGLAGFIYLLDTRAGNATFFSGVEMQAIAAAIIGGVLLTGGVGNIFGALFGVLILATIDQMVWSLGLSQPWLQGVLVGVMLCIFIVLQSIILGFRSRRRSGLTKSKNNSPSPVNMENV